MSRSSQRVFEGPLEELASVLNGQAVRRALILCGPSQRFVARLKVALAGVECEVFPGAQRHVPAEVVGRAAAALKASGADCIIALGGGSATGLGKALRLEHELTFVAVPTTYSGSEYTTLYGITEAGKKQTGRDQRVQPDVVVCDSSLTIDMPLNLSVTSLLNAAAHPLARLTQGDAKLADHDQCERALAAVIGALEAVLAAPRSIAARARAMRAARLAAYAIEAGALGKHHQIVHRIGGSLDVEHGALHSILLPHSVRYFRDQAPDVLRRIGRSLDVPDLEALLFEYLVRAGAKRSLMDLGLAWEQLEGLVDEDDACRQLVRDAFHGQRPSSETRRQDFGLPEPVLLSGPELQDAKRVVLCVHGRGSNAGAILTRAQQILGDDATVTLVAPQARDNRWYRQRYHETREAQGQELGEALQWLKQLFEEITKHVPPERLVLFGFSQGACLVLELFVELDIRLAAVVALSGARIGKSGEGKVLGAGLSGTPVLLGKSERDPFLEGGHVEAAATALSEAGCEVTLRVVPGDDHGFYAQHRILARPLLSGAPAKEMLSGFGGFHSSEGLPGALPTAQNSPYPAPYGLVAEQVNATGFSVGRALNQRSWLYRVRPAAQLRSLEVLAHPTLLSDFEGRSPEPNLVALPPRRMPTDEPVDFVDGLVTLAGAGSASSRRGFAIYTYVANRNMETRAYSSADGSLLLIPESGALTLLTELGLLSVLPGQVALLPRGLRFSVLLGEGRARGYMAEVFGQSFQLPERGPVGANGLSDARHFLAPVAWHEDRLATAFELVIKSCGTVYRSTQDYSPFDVVAWHGNYVPYVYDLSHFAPVANVHFDHVDPSVYTVLSAPLDEPGANNLDFVVFVPRWDATQHTFRPPYFHRNVTSEFNGIIRHRGSGAFAPGSAFLTPSMLPHGIVAERLPPSRPEGELPAAPPNTNELWFQFETTLPVALSGWAEAHRSSDWRGVWGGYRSRFRTRR